MNRINKNDSTPTNNQNKMDLPEVDNHKKYSINKVKIKYNKQLRRMYYEKYGEKYKVKKEKRWWERG